VEAILQNRGILKHSDAILATSRAEPRLEVIPWTLKN
jgi:hypothetical protein